MSALPGAPESFARDRGTLLTVFCATLIACQVFPVRVAGFDSAIATVLLAMLLLWPERLYWRPAVAVGIATALLVYTIGVVVAQADVEFFVAARQARFTISAAALALIVAALPRGERFVHDVIRYAVLAHALAIFVEILYPGTRDVIAPLVGVNADRTALALRAFGIAGSYDTAGLMLSTGLVLAMTRYWNAPRNRWLLEGMFMWGAGLFTGRTFWVTGSALFAVLLILAMVRGRGVTRYLVAGGAVSGVVALAVTFGPLLMLSLFPETISAGNEQVDRMLRSAGYYPGTTLTLSESISYPRGAGLLFGLGNSAVWTDFGYVKLLYMNGIVGLAMLLAFYLLLAGPSLVALARWRGNSADFVVVAVLALLLAYNVKVLVLGSRAGSELFMLLAYARLTRSEAPAGAA